MTYAAWTWEKNHINLNLFPLYGYMLWIDLMGSFV